MKTALLAMAAWTAWSAAAMHGATRAADLARALRESQFDADECYRVRDVVLVREDIRLYLNEGTVLFAQPVEGRIRAALFAAEDGDGEVLMMPPTRGERASLASFIGSPNLDEHVRAALLVFTDDTGAELKQALEKGSPVRRLPDLGLVLKPVWDPVLKSFMTSLQIRLVQDGLAGREAKASGFFYAALSSKDKDRGNFDLIYDPAAREQITSGQLVHRDDRTFFDVWTSFPARLYRSGKAKAPGLGYSMSSISVDAALDDTLHMTAKTRGTLKAERRIDGALGFEISRRVRIQSARIDGEAAEVFQTESLRAGLTRSAENSTFLVVPGRTLEAGTTHQIEFDTEGDVISPAGNNVYYVGSRGSWYPRIGLEFATYDLTFRYPANLTLVATGELVEERQEGEVRITRRRAASPVRFAGFNLGVYDKTAVRNGPFSVEVYANRRAEPILEHQPVQRPVPAWLPTRRLGGGEMIDLPPFPQETIVDPQSGARRLAADVGSALEYLASMFGPPPLKTLTVSPIPGSFGQGFPGLLYLSTVAYLNTEQRPAILRDARQTTFFNDMLAPHETAHQWWGNLVVSAGYQSDWIMEALANYSALMYIEKRKGAKAFEAALEQLKHELLAKIEGGEIIESTGPIIWGTRLARSKAPDAWRVITYDKGAWIIHMLRRRIGDARFVLMLGDLRKTYEYKALDTDEFRSFAARYLPPGSSDPALQDFFEEWVEGTGIPALKLHYSIHGKAPAVRLTGSVGQSDVGEEFSAWVPLLIQFGKGDARTEWVRTGSDAPQFSVALKQVPAKVTLDTRGVLCR